MTGFSLRTAAFSQGCPGSAFLFDAALDPFLAAFEKVLTNAGRGIQRACADDIGIAIKSLSALRYVFPIFQSAECIAGMTLKPKKCILIPTSEPFSEELVRSIQRWLTTNIPAWANFSIKSSGKYLGFFLGPTADKEQWKEPVDKFVSRAKALHKLQTLFPLTPIFTTVAVRASYSIKPSFFHYHLALTLKSEQLCMPSSISPLIHLIMLLFSGFILLEAPRSNRPPSLPVLRCAEQLTILRTFGVSGRGS